MFDFTPQQLEFTVIAVFFNKSMFVSNQPYAPLQIFTLQFWVMTK